MSEDYLSVVLVIRENKVAVHVISDQTQHDLDLVMTPVQEYEDLRLGPNGLDLDVLHYFRSQIESGKITSKIDFQMIGRLLYRLLFTDKVTNKFNEVNRFYKPRSNKRMRVVLEFRGEDHKGLAKLPWEFLCYPKAGNWEFVSTVHELVLTRNLTPDENADNEQVLKVDGKKISVLLVVLDPELSESGLSRLTSAGEQVREQLSTFESQARRNGINIEVQCIEKEVTWVRFIDELQKRECQPHILHLIAHGDFGDDKGSWRGRIAFEEPEKADVGFEDEPGVKGAPGDWKSDVDFVNAFKKVGKLPRVAFLHMCKSGAIDKQHGSAGVALRMAEAGVPAVVAMQHEIVVATSIAFSKEFYEQLGNGSTVDEAVQMGRNSIAAENSHDRAFGTPVLYLSTTNDVLPRIPISSGERRAKSSKIISSDEHSTLHGDIFKKQLDRGIMTKDELMELYRHMGGLCNTCTIDEWKSELNNMIASYSLFDDKDRARSQICHDVLLSIRREFEALPNT